MGLALALIYILSCTYSLLPVTAISPPSVPDDAVWTSPSETFLVGQSGASLKCSFQENPIAVYWLKGELLQTAMPLITWYRGEITTQNEGFEFGPDFSLLFEHPGISDTGRYYCRVSNHQGILSSNHTDLTVLVQESDEVDKGEAGHHYLRVTQCGGDPFDQDSPCIIKVHPDQDILELDCIVEGAHQPVLLTWHNAGALHISLNTTSSSEKILEDGKYLKKISLRLHTEEMESERKRLICMAQGPNATETVNVTIQFEPEIPEEGPSTVGIVVGVIFILAVISALVAFVVWKKLIKRPREKAQRKNQEELEMLDKTTEEKRKKVLAFRPQNTTKSPSGGSDDRPPPIHLGVFGLSRAGKSAFINSLFFAVTGNYSSHIADESNQKNQRTKWREAKTLTPYINILDNRGLKNYNNVISEPMEQIRGRRGQIPQRTVKDGDVVDCPILICNFSKESRDENATKFISDFSREVYELLGLHNNNNNNSNNKYKRWKGPRSFIVFHRFVKTLSPWSGVIKLFISFRF
ncbi:uncharacterized protein LOC135154834 isoform X2 [Lytechinus pictus]|uniref:uncharacterized protein LOC135154834 isoform X2 n=1 Tax=Lytechinus pictus TaxID=7653 RepID=UPI0030B9B741